MLQILQSPPLGDSSAVPPPQPAQRAARTVLLPDPSAVDLGGGWPPGSSVPPPYRRRPRRGCRPVGGRCRRRARRGGATTRRPGDGGRSRLPAVPRLDPASWARSPVPRHFPWLTSLRPARPRPRSPRLGVPARRRPAAPRCVPRRPESDAGGANPCYPRFPCRGTGGTCLPPENRDLSRFPQAKTSSRVRWNRYGAHTTPPGAVSTTKNITPIAPNP